NPFLSAKVNPAVLKRLDFVLRRRGISHTLRIFGYIRAIFSQLNQSCSGDETALLSGIFDLILPCIKVTSARLSARRDHGTQRPEARQSRDYCASRMLVLLRFSAAVLALMTLPALAQSPAGSEERLR